MKKEFEKVEIEVVEFEEEIKTTDSSSNPGTGEWEGDENVPGNGTEGWV